MSYDPRIAYLEPLSVTGRVRAGVHDVAQSLTRTSVALICRKAIPILANRVFKLLLSTTPGGQKARASYIRAGLLLGCSAGNA
jgi:hypothetical protein